MRHRLRRYFIYFCRLSTVHIGTYITCTCTPMFLLYREANWTELSSSMYAATSRKHRKQTRNKDRYNADGDGGCASTADRDRHEQYFSFYSRKQDLSRMIDRLLASHVLDDVNDFWNFVRKYEDMRKLKNRSKYERSSRNKKTTDFTSKVIYILYYRLHCL